MFSGSDLRILRELALRVREIAHLPIQAQRIALWKQHNRLGKAPPMLMVFPEGAWRELLPEAGLQCQDAAARSIETELRCRIYQHEHFMMADNVIEDYLDVRKVIVNSGWGLTARRKPSTQSVGAWAFDPLINSPADLKKMHHPCLEYDEKASLQKYEQMREALGDILTVRLRGVTHISYHLMAQWSGLRGLEQVMIDMAESPQFVHDAMCFLVEGLQKELQQLMAQNLLELNNDNTYHSSGGNGWTDELPAPGYDGRHVRPLDMWSSAESQELAQVSPEMHAEFALHYEKQLLAPFALTGYGCCEALDRKLDDVLSIGNIRRISISPWADVELSAAKLQRRVIFSWKPMPAMLCGQFNEQHIRQYLRHALEATGDCELEIILKDTHTVDHQPWRMDRWMQIAREEITRATASAGQTLRATR